MAVRNHPVELSEKIKVANLNISPLEGENLQRREPSISWPLRSLSYTHTDVESKGLGCRRDLNSGLKYLREVMSSK